MSKPNPRTFGFRGTIMHCIEVNRLEILEDGLLLIGNGSVLFLGPAKRISEQLSHYDITNEDLTVLGKHEFVMPGLVDTHIHACQYPNLGLGQDMPLLQWLSTYTFPLEAQFKDQCFAQSVYEAVVDRTLSAGTTCASYFSSIHRPATEILADICIDKGQRALVGKTCMDTNGMQGYCETTDESLQETSSFIKSLLSRREMLVQPTVTPRFAVSCSERLLHGLGEIARSHDLHVQSHLSETRPEVDLVRELFPNAAHYTDVYQKAGLLGEKTIMAHGVHLEREELAILGATSTGLAHCPDSNISLMSGLCNVRRISQAGIHVGLGTDVSGGTGLSVLESIRSALMTSKLLCLQGSLARDEVVDYRQAFYMATLGGARALGLHAQIGNFAVGKRLDALVVSLSQLGSTVDVLTPLSADQMLQKFLMLGGVSEIKHVFVNGLRVAGTKEV